MSVVLDKLLDLLHEIEAAEVELEELEECGDLEERLEAAQRLEDLRAEHFKQSCRDMGEE